jgi:hypothetical protein
MQVLLNDGFREVSGTDSHTEKKGLQTLICNPFHFYGAPGGARTPGLRIRRQDSVSFLTSSYLISFLIFIMFLLFLILADFGCFFRFLPIFPTQIQV